MGLDLEVGGRGEQEVANDSTLLADELVLPAATRMASSAFKLLDVRRVAAELMASATGDSQPLRILVDDEDMMVSIVALRRGRRMAEHVASGSAVIVPLIGRLRFATGNGIVDLSPGRFMFVGGNRDHEIFADEDAALMLVLTK